MSTLFGVPVDAVYHIVFALTNVLTPVLGGLAAVVGIVVCTAAVRLLVTPLTFRALRGQAAQARLAPEIQRLRQRYAKKPDRLQRELTALYQREGTSMFAGFAPLLAQWPVFSVLYLLFRSPTVGGAPNRLLSRDLLGVPLGSHWLSGAGVLSVHGAVFLGVLAVLAAACWLAARSARRAAAADRVGQPGSGRRRVEPAGAHRRDQGPAVPHGADRRVRAPGRGDLPDHLDRLERRRAPRLRGQRPATGQARQPKPETDAARDWAASAETSRQPTQPRPSRPASTERKPSAN